MSLASSFAAQCRLQPQAAYLVVGDITHSWTTVAHWVFGALAHLEELQLDDSVVLGSKTEDEVERIVWMLAASWAGYTWSLSHTVSSKSIHWVEAPLESRSNVTSEPKIWSSHQPHWLLQSSGTTGEPKLISLTWDQIEANARGAEERFKLTPRDRWLCVLPLGHVAGASIVARSCVIGFSVCLDEFNAERFSLMVNLQGITISSVVPTMLSRVIAYTPQAPDPLRVLMVGGAAFPKTLETLAEDWPVWLTWGMSETASQIATSPMAEALEHGLEPIKDVKISVDDEDFLCVHGTIAPNDFWRTSDVGSVNSMGRVRVHGRGDDVIKVAGNRVNLARVRRIFEEKADALEFEVFSISDEEFGQQVGLAFKQVIDGSLDALLHASEGLEVWERPHWLMPVLELPLNHRFKFDRDQLARECEVRRKRFRKRPGRMTFLPGDQLMKLEDSIDSFVYKDSEGRVTL